MVDARLRSVPGNPVDRRRPRLDVDAGGVEAEGEPLFRTPGRRSGSWSDRRRRWPGGAERGARRRSPRSPFFPFGGHVVVGGAMHLLLTWGLPRRSTPG